jgi:multidrug efflux pump
MIINKAALHRQSTVLVLLTLIVLAGAYSYAVLPRESAPDITIPYIFVTTDYEGVAPEDMETLVTIPLERKLKGISDTEEIRSVSDDGVSFIAIKFLPSVDIDDALQKVRDKVDQAKGDLPPDLPDDPVVSEANFSDIPIINVVLSGNFSLKRLKVFAEEFEDRFESIPGVLDAVIIGGLEREIHVEFDIDRVAFYNMPVSSLISALSSGNVNMPGGSMDIGKAKYLVRTPEDFQHPEEINNIVAFVRDGKPVYLRDVASIRDHHKDPQTRSRIDGRASVTIAVKKRSGENIIRITDEIKQVVEEMRHQFPPSLQIVLTADQSKDIRLMVTDLENNILSGLLLVLAVVLVFIGGRSALFVAAAIPISMLITFSLLYALGITLNMVVLFSLTLALGMLVDNGIVIVENIYRHMQEGKGRWQAALEGTNEVAWPVTTSTLTTAGAFLPMIFWPGIMGEFMSFLPKTVIIALFGSLFVALVVNPVLSSRWQTTKPPKAPKAGSATASLSLSRRAYRALLLWSLRNRGLVVITSFLLLMGMITAFGMFGKGVEFFPDVEPDRAYVTVKAPVGTNLDASDTLVQQVEALAAEYPDIEHYIANLGEAAGDAFSHGASGTHISSVTLVFKELKERSRPSSEILDEMRERLLASIRGAEIQVEKEEGGPPTGKPVNLEIYGKDLRLLGEMARNIRGYMEQVPGLVDVKDNFVEGKPEIKVRVDKEKAALMGLDTYQVAYTVKTAINGAKVGVYREGKDEYDIIARLPEKNRSSVEDLTRITVSGPNGEPIPLTSLATVEVGSGLGGINRIDQKRVVTVSSDVSGVLANDVIPLIDKHLQELDWPRGYSYAFTGEQQEQAKAQAFLSKAFIVAIFLIFLVLVTQFDSFSAPLIIIASVALSLIGVFLGLLVTGTAFGVIMTGVGVISLAGVVVNNAIVLIDYFNQLKASGLPPMEALVQTGLIRFRPVLLTAITTILGLLPMATGVSYDFVNLRWDIGGESSQWWGSMAVAVIFGLAVATLLTLVVVPVLCSITESLNARREAKRERKALRRQEKASAKAEAR